MKKIFVTILAALLVMAFTACFWSCGNIPTTQPQKLQAPTITLTGNTATWEGDINAQRFEISIDGNLSYVENTVSSKTLSEGQSLKVRAVGDGVSYLTSDWSNVVTYLDSSKPNDSDVSSDSNTQGNPTDSSPTDSNPIDSNPADSNPADSNPIDPNPDNPTPDNPTPDDPAPDNPNPPAEDAPTYLGILGTKKEPNKQDGIPDVIRPANARALSSLLYTNSTRAYEEALNEYYQNQNNHLDKYPSGSSYNIYAKPNETVYIQIWLNNPAQYTILSLKLNGVKYQVGGGFSSFFIEDNGVHYNCVYVAVTIPQSDHTEKSYVVSDIEYISKTFINPDGTDEFMNENDTVTIGLPYNAQMPTANAFDTTDITANGAEITFNVSDTDNLKGLSEGWLGVMAYDGYNVVFNKEAKLGSNTISLNSLVEESSYTIYAYIYADLHDGKGVVAHTIGTFGFTTLSAVDYFNVEAGYYSNADFTEWGGEEADSGLSINVELYLTSSTAKYDRLELYNGEELVLTDTEFSYYKTYEDLLAETTYKVRIYYSDKEYSEHFVEEYVTTGRLEKPKMELQEVYSFVNSVGFVFEYPGSGFLGVANYKNLHVRISNSHLEEVRYQDYILNLCDDPTILARLQKEFDDAIDRGDWGTANIIEHEGLLFYQIADDLMKNGEFSDNGTDKAKWQQFFSQYSRTFYLGDDNFFNNDFNGYLIFKDYFTMFADEYCEYEVIADVDMKDGKGFVKTVLNSGQEHPVPINHEYNDVDFDVSIDGFNITINPSCSFDGEDYDLAIISYTVNIYNNRWELVDTLYTSKEINLKDFDEDAWINAYVLAMKGEAILPSEDAIIEYFDWRAIFEILLNVEFPEEDDFDSNGNGDIVVDGNGAIVHSEAKAGRGEKNIANQKERQLLRDLLEYDYPNWYEYRLKSQMINDFMCDEYYYDLIQGLDNEDEILESLISGALNSSIIRVLNSCISGIQHYMTWNGSSEDEIYVGFKQIMEGYIEDNNLTPNVNWAESYRRVMMFEDFYYFYPYGEFERVEIEIDKDKYSGGEYHIGVVYRYDSYDEDYYSTHWVNDSVYITSKLPSPTISISNDGYIEEIRAEVEDFWEYHYEVEIKNKQGTVIFSGSSDSLTEGYNQLSIGSSIKARTVFNDGASSNLYTGNSEWTEWIIFEGIKLPTIEVNYSYDQGGVEWYYYSNEISHFVYTINDGEERVAVKDGNHLIPLNNNDVLMIKAVPTTEAKANGYIDSDYTRFICDDERQSLDAPNIAINDGVLTWNAVPNAEYYIIEETRGATASTTEIWGTEFGDIKPGCTYRVRAKSTMLEFKASPYSEAVTNSVKLDNPVILRASANYLRWEGVEYAEGYYYKIGINGQIQSVESPALFFEKIEIYEGDEIYVQAYAEGCISSDWVLMYTYSKNGK